MINFRRIFSKDPDLRSVQDEVYSTFNSINTMPWMNGVILPGVALVGGSVDNTISHGLERVPVGFIVMAKTGVSDIYTSPTVNPLPELTILIRSVNAVTVTLWIF